MILQGWLLEECGRGKNVSHCLTYNSETVCVCARVCVCEVIFCLGYSCCMVTISGDVIKSYDDVITNRSFS